MPAQLPKRYFTLIIGLLSSCVFPGSNRSQKSEIVEQALTDKTVKVDPINVAEGWQKKALKTLEDEKEFDELYALFSEGGYSDAGQIFVILDHKTKKAKLYSVPARSQELDPVVNLDDKKLQTFLENIKEADQVEKLTQHAFDGLQYEYLHAEKKDAKVLILKRTFMNNPGIGAAKPEHSKLLETFRKLRS